MIISTYRLGSTASVMVLLLETGGGIQDCLSVLRNKCLSISIYYGIERQSESFFSKEH